MIPKLYGASETQFTGGPICYLPEGYDFEVTEVLNGIYELEFKYPVSGKAFPELYEGRYVCCIHDDYKDEQPFRIYASDTPIDGIVTFYAHHISYALSNIILEPFTATSALGAMQKLTSEAINPNPFTFTSNLSRTSNYELSEPTSVRAALYGDKESIATTYAGELEFDKWTVKFNDRRGETTGVTIRYGKNLIDINQSLGVEEAYNAIVPYWSGKINGVDVIIMPEGNDRIVQLPNSGTPVPIAKNFSSDFKNSPAVSDLIQAARDFLTANEPWNPTKNITIDFVELWQTDEYENVASLQRVRLGDTVSVYHPDLNITVDEIEVIKVVYDPLAEKYLSMELGSEKTTFVQNLTNSLSSQIFQEVSGFESLLTYEINHATELIRNPGEGYIRYVGTDDDGNLVYGSGAVQNPSEMWIMNDPNPANATKMLIINVNGIGFSNGINDLIKTAWTLDGHFVADFITAGTINGNMIRAGMISDYNGATWSLTEDVEIQEGKGYYTRSVVDPEAAEPEYTYTLVEDPVVSGLGTYYEYTTSQSHNYWNLETGEFRLSPNTKIGNETVIGYVEDSLSQEGVFNALTNDGAIRTITMDANGNLYINADWINTGHIDAGKIRLFGKMDVFKDNTSFLSANKGGYLGFGYGSQDGFSTNGMIIGHDGEINSGGLWVNTYNFLIVTDAGVRMTAIKSGTTQRDFYLTGAEAVCNADLRFEKSPYTHDIKDVYNISADAKISCARLVSSGQIEGGNIFSNDYVYAVHDMWCSGTKSRLVKTDNYSDRLLYSYEMPSPIFGDLGSGTIAEDGKAYIYIDPVFSETVNTSNYQVFLQAYGSNPVYVSERKADYFVVSGTSGTEFGWEIKAKQSDFDQRRLEEKKLEMEKPEQPDFSYQATEMDYGKMASEHFKSLRNERIAI